MNPRAGSLSETLLERLDRWNVQGHWLQDPEDWFPARVFFGIFAWNLPILLIALGAIGAMFYRADPDPAGVGMFTPLNWVVELSLTTIILAVTIDAVSCLWLRRLWNKRARWLRKEANNPS